MLSVDLGVLDTSIGLDKIVINLQELTGNIWMADLEEQ